MRRGILLLAGAMVLAGCAHRGELSAEAGQDLQALAGDVRAAAESSDRPDAAAHLEELRETVQSWLEEGGIDDRRASLILDAALDVERNLALLPAPVEEPTEEETVEPTPDEDEAKEEEKEEEEEEKDEDEDDDSGPGGGGGKGRGGGNSGSG
jgi:hypothetical protein